MNNKSSMTLDMLNSIFIENSTYNSDNICQNTILSDMGFSSIEIVSILLEIELTYPVSMSEIDVSQHSIRSIHDLIISRQS